MIVVSETTVVTGNVHALAGVSGSPSASWPGIPSSVPNTTNAAVRPLTFHCAACILDYREPYCDCCGAHLNPHVEVDA